MAEHMYSAEEAAQLLGLQVRTVRNYVREGRLPGVRIGKQYRIARADLEAFTAGTVAADGMLPSAARPPGESPGAAVAEVSSVAQVDAIGAQAAERLERTLLAVAAGAASREGAPLRVEPLYDAERQRMKVIVVGSLAETADVLRIVDSLTREPA